MSGAEAFAATPAAPPVDRPLRRRLVAAAGPATVPAAPGTGFLAGRVLGVASVLPALLATAWLVAAFPLAALGWFRPATVIPLAVLAAALAVPLGRAVYRHAATLTAPWWSVLATAAV